MKEEKPQSFTARIEEIIFDLLEKNKEGVRWVGLLSEIKKVEPTFHPKTINGTVWKLLGKYPDKVYKPQKGLFRLTKYK